MTKKSTQTQFERYAEELRKADCKYFYLNKAGTAGRFRFKFLGLEKEFSTKQIELRDAHEIGLIFAADILKLGNVPLDPERKTRKYPFTTWQVIHIEEKEGKLSKEIRKAFTESVSFGELYEEMSVGKSSAGQRKNRIQELTFYDDDINSISESQIRAQILETRTWENRVKNDGSLLGETALGLIHADIIKVFNYAQSKGVLFRNPCKLDRVQSVKSNIVVGSKREGFTPDEQNELYDAAAYIDANQTIKKQTRFIGQYELLVRLGIATGARNADLTYARWDDFTNLEDDGYTSTEYDQAAEWSFKQLKHKGERNFNHDDNNYRVTHSLYWYGPLLGLLREAYANRKSDYVFEAANGEGVLGKGNVGEQFTLIIKQANEFRESILRHNSQVKLNIVGNPHKMRHTTACNIISHKGITNPWQQAADKLGHASIKTTLAHYGGLFNKTFKSNEAEMASMFTA